MAAAGTHPGRMLAGRFSTWLFLLPALLFFAGYQVYPILRVTWISFHRLRVPRRRTGRLGRPRQLRRGAAGPAAVGRAGQGGLVHPDVPARHHPLPAAAGDSRRPRRQPHRGHPVPRGAADSRGDPEHPGVRPLEVDVQLPDRADQPLPGRGRRPLHLPRRPAVAGRHLADPAGDRRHGDLVGAGGTTPSSSSPASRRSRAISSRRRAPTAPTSGSFSGTSPCRGCSRS